MTSPNPQFATTSHGNVAGSESEPGRLSGRITPSILAATSAGYFLVALGWSASGRTDIPNSRAASGSAVIAISIALAVAILSFHVKSGFVARAGWLALASGITCIAAIEIASLSVLITDSVNLWRPAVLDWLLATGAIAVLAGVTLISMGDRLRLDIVSAVCGLLSTALTCVTAILILLHVIGSNDLKRWHIVAPIVALSALVVAALIAWNLFQTADQDDQLSACGVALFTFFMVVSALLQYTGFQDASAGIVALGRWVIPVAVLGLATFAFSENGLVHGESFLSQNWQHWSISSGPAPWIAGIVLSIGATASLIFSVDVAPDIASVAAGGIALLIARQTVTLHRKRSEVEELRTSAEELQRIANIDKLTGLPNRAALDQRLSEEFERAYRYEQPLSLLFADIDRFKSVNDTYGHAMGDLLLQEIARMLRFTARSIDYVARYGGEEFVVVAPGTWSADALILAERLRSAIETNDNPQLAYLGTTTISIGIAGYPEHAEDLQLLLERADKALYQAKSTGRNRTVLFGQESGTEERS